MHAYAAVRTSTQSRMDLVETLNCCRRAQRQRNSCRSSAFVFPSSKANYARRGGNGGGGDGSERAVCVYAKLPFLFNSIWVLRVYPTGIADDIDVIPLVRCDCLLGIECRAREKHTPSGGNKVIHIYGQNEYVAVLYVRFADETMSGSATGGSIRVREGLRREYSDVNGNFRHWIIRARHMEAAKHSTNDECHRSTTLTSVRERKFTYIPVPESS